MSVQDVIQEMKQEATRLEEDTFVSMSEWVHNEFEAKRLRRWVEKLETALTEDTKLTNKQES